jgi:hypothetical protein
MIIDECATIMASTEQIQATRFVRNALRCLGVGSLCLLLQVRGRSSCLFLPTVARRSGLQSNATAMRCYAPQRRDVAGINHDLGPLRWHNRECRSIIFLYCNLIGYPQLAVPSGRGILLHSFAMRDDCLGNFIVLNHHFPSLHV